ncbi:MAG: UDP-2,3-diacylglucosamine diphosphatase [Candidatus Bathyarchaeia archaeon]
MKVVVVSDQHLGYVNSDMIAFNQFLDELTKDDEITNLVLLGDVLDMWRRDSSGVFLESKDTINKILSLTEKMTVHYVAGNHDFHVLRLQNFAYPFSFEKTLTLRDGKYTYLFLHGWEFDLMQQEPLMEALCRVMSDEAGDFESGVWATLTGSWSDIEFLLTFLFRKERIRKIADTLQTRPEERLRNILGDIEKRACNRAKIIQPNGVLVFGHTHRPFVNTTETVANSGSWVTDAPVHNTYVELSNGRPRLFQFGGQEIKERVEC